jgi:hypothetical protein
VRLLRNVASNVASEPIAVTVLQQQNSVQRSAKKAVAHQWQEGLISRAVADASVEGMAPCLVQRGNGAHRFPLRELTRRMPVYFSVVARAHRFPWKCNGLCKNYSQKLGFSQCKTDNYTW